MSVQNFDSVTLLKSFAEAGNALELLPKVQADLGAAHSLIDEVNSKLISEQSKTSLLQSTIETLQAELAAKEAALADATKSLDNRDSTIAAVHKLLGVVVQPAPEPVAATNTTEGDQMGNADAPADDTQTTTASETHSAAEQSETSAEAPATVHPETSSPSAPPQPAPGQSSNTESTTNPGAAPEGEHTPTTNAGPSDGADADGLAYQRQNAPETPDYSRTPYWAKPSTITYSEFKAHGGLVPDWIEDEAKQAAF